VGVRITTGITALDFFLSGGFQVPSIIHVYGEPGTGKSTLGYHLVSCLHEKGLGTIWFDFNSSFSMKRLLSISKNDQVLQTLRLYQLESGNQLSKSLNQLKIRENEKLLVLDNFTYYYQLSNSEDKRGTFYNMLHHQLMRILAAVRRNNMICFLINQVRTSSNGDFYPVGGSLMNEISQYVITTRHEDGHFKLEVMKGEINEENLMYSLSSSGWEVK